MHWQIRLEQPEDIDELRRLYIDARVYAFTWLDTSIFKPDDFDVATEDEEVWVAVSHGKPIGFISCWLPDNFIHNLYVDPQFLGQGVGKALLNQGLARLERPAFLKCLQQNTNAVSFYKKQGWQIKSEGISQEGLYHLMTVDK